jgi:ABC-type dipeptide/oligopeptide/nickel transport system ATPase subunit
MAANGHGRDQAAAPSERIRTLVADLPTDPKKIRDPSTLVWAYTPVEDPAIYANVFKPFTDYLTQCTGKRIVYYPVQSNAAEIEAMRSGRLRFAGFSTGPTGFAVNMAGAVPFAAKGDEQERAWLRRYPPADVDHAFRLLDQVGLSGFATRRADALSGGQRQRVGIARAIMQQPELILADEPTSSLDPKTSVEIMDILAGLAGERGIPVVVNIHNVELARRFAHRIVGTARGAVVFDGTPAELADRRLNEIYGGEDWMA